MFRTSIALLLLIGAAGPAVAVSPDPKSLNVPPQELARARELVKQLGSDQYPEREAAEEALGKMGRLARPALLEAVNGDPDPEIRVRCSTLMPRANSLEIKARLEVFLADVEGKYEHDLPGWSQFRSVIRNEWSLLGYPVWSDRSLDSAARNVFVELIASPVNRGVILATAGSRSDLGMVVAARRQELYNQRFPRPVGGALGAPVTRRDPTAEDVATLLFGESLVPSRFAPRAVSISFLISVSGFSSQVHNTDEKGKVYRTLAIAWLESRRDPAEAYQAMTIATNLNLPQQALRLAVRVFATPGTQAFYRGNAAAKIATLGGKEHIPLLEKSLEDSAVLTMVQTAVPGKPGEWVRHELQIRDLALAVAIHLAGQNAEEYGFVDQFKANSGVAGIGFTYTRYYLTEEKRKAAFEKWKAFRQK